MRDMPEVTGATPRRRTWAAATDEDLVRGVRRGEDGAFAELHARYRPVLHRYAGRFLGADHGGVEDVLQDVFQRTHAALTGDGARPLLLRPWLFRLTHNRAIDELRSSRRLQPHGERFEDSLPTAPLEAEVADRLALQETLADIASLPARQRAALVGAVLEGRSHEELAARLDTTAGASKALVNRARGGLIELRAARGADLAGAVAA